MTRDEPRNSRWSHGVKLLLSTVAATAVMAAAPAGFWLEVPFVKQRENGCGAASASMLIQYWSREYPHLKRESADRIFELLYSPQENGVPAGELVRYLEQVGLETFTLKGDWELLRLHLLRGRPLIVALSEGRGNLHYVVVAGLHSGHEVVLLNDPARRERFPISRQEFERAWNKAGGWTLLALPGPALRQGGSAQPVGRQPLLPSEQALSGPERGSTEEEDYRSGMDLACAGQWREARAAFLQGQSRNPADARYPLQLAGVALREGDQDSARRHLKRALALDPGNAYAHHFLGSLYYLEDNLEAAIKTWNRVGRPRIEGLRLELPAGVDPVLVERALRVPSSGLLKWEDLLHSQARLDLLEIFSDHRFELVARENGAFDLRLRARRRGLKAEQGAARFAGPLGGLPFQTLDLRFSPGGSPLKLATSLRWHPDRRRLYSSASGPLGGDPAWRYRLHLDGRQENWDVSTAAGRAFLGNPEFSMSRLEAGAQVASVPAARWKWSSGVLLSHRAFGRTAPVADPSFESGWVLKHASAVEHQLVRSPERSLTVHSFGRGELGKRLVQDRGSFSKLSGGLRLRWAAGKDYLLSGEFHSGAAWGRLPFDELFVLGLERDSDLRMRAHVGTRGGKKGSAPLGTRYLLLNWELDRTLHESGPLKLQAGPFLDSGRVFDATGRFGTDRWLWDTGLQVKLRVFGSPVVLLSCGRDLRTGRISLYATLSRH